MHIAPGLTARGIRIGRVGNLGERCSYLVPDRFRGGRGAQYRKELDKGGSQCKPIGTSASRAQAATRSGAGLFQIIAPPERVTGRLALLARFARGPPRSRYWNVCTTVAIGTVFKPQNCGAVAQTLLATGRAPGIPDLLRFYNRFCLQRDRSVTDARRAGYPSWRG